MSLVYERHTIAFFGPLAQLNYQMYSVVITNNDIFTSYTHVKISQVVASLQTSRQQVVFARLATSCQQVWNKLLTTCNNLVGIVRLVTRLFQQVCYNHNIFPGEILQKKILLLMIIHRHRRPPQFLLGFHPFTGSFSSLEGGGAKPPLAPPSPRCLRQWCQCMFTYSKYNL